MILIGVRIFLDSCDKDHVKKVETTDNCFFREHEMTRTNALQRSIKNGSCLNGYIKNNHDQVERRLLNRIFNLAALLEDAMVYVERIHQEKVAGEHLLDKFRRVRELCETVQTKIKDIKLPILKPIICERTDAGPSLGINNHGLCFGAAQRARSLASDYFIRCHLVQVIQVTR